MATLERGGRWPVDRLAQETLIGDQREANAQMVQVALRAQELAEEAEEARARTEMMAAELRESEERYRILFALSPAAVYACDASGVIQQFNHQASALWGREPKVGANGERFCGSFKLFRTDGTPMPHEGCPMAFVVAGDIPEVREAEVVIERPDGSRVNVIVNIRALKNQRGEITGAINCFWDITARKRAQEQLSESLRREREVAQFREMFIGILGHDLRNPLAAITLTANALLSQGRLSKPHSAAVGRINRSGERMSRMVTWLLDLTHARLGGGLPIDPQPTDLRKICRNIVEDFAAKIVLELDGDLRGVWDADRLEQVFSNLVRNAIEYGKRGAPVIVKARPDGPAAVVVEILHKGNPIPPDVLPFIFQPFRRANLREKSKTGNLGLGLYIANEIVAAHQGTLKARSIGDATTLEMRLPQQLPREDVVSKGRRERRQRKGGSRRRTS